MIVGVAMDALVTMEECTHALIGIIQVRVINNNSTSTKRGRKSFVLYVWWLENGS